MTWNQYRRKYLNKQGWTQGSPGAYYHKTDTDKRKPFYPLTMIMVDGQETFEWQQWAAVGQTPAPF